MTDTRGEGRRVRMPNRIREIRQARGITMETLGDAVGMHFTTISKIEKSQRGCAMETLKDIAQVLRVTTDELLGRDAAPAPDAGTPDTGDRRTTVGQTCGARSLAAARMRAEIDDVADMVAMLPGLDDRDATLAAAIAFGLPAWMEHGRLDQELGERVATALRTADAAMNSGNPTMYRITAAGDAMTAVLLGASLTGPWSGDETIGMLEQAMTLHPTQRDAYGLLIHLQKAKRRH